jgi:hypothetical protein
MVYDEGSYYYYYSEGLFYNYTQVKELYNDTINLAPRKQLGFSSYTYTDLNKV